MKIEKIIKKNKIKYELVLSNGEVLDTYEEVIISNHLLGNNVEIDKKTYDKIIKEGLVQEKYNECLKYIKNRLRSEKEIRDYLLKKNINIEDINCIVNKLQKSPLDYFETPLLAALLENYSSGVSSKQI